MDMLKMIFEACQKGNLHPMKMLFVGYYNKTVPSKYANMLKQAIHDILSRLTNSADLPLKSQTLFV